MKTPEIAENVFTAPDAVILGDVQIEEECSIWFHAVVRAEAESIRIGRGSNIQDNAVIHVDAGHPVRIGTGVTIGHGAIIHGCSIGDNTLIGMGAIILNGASVGGKTGINFNGLKNEIGSFAPADSVLIETEFLRSLDAQNFFSGYAEMLKHGLISNTAHWVELLDFNTNNIDYAYLKNMVGRSVQVKEDIVEQDPFERGIRKALNLGHTAGHAFESLALAENRPVLHGYAVAWGIVCELYLSHLKVGFPKDKMRQTIQFIKENYGSFAFDCKQYEQLYAFMQHDKKNTSGTVNFTLLKEIGDICINQTADKDTIFEMLDFYRECMGV